MQFRQSSGYVVTLIVAIVLAGASVFGLEHAPAIISTSLLLILLTVVIFSFLRFMQIMRVSRRRPSSVRRGDRSTNTDRGDLTGVREPRRPLPSLNPARGVALEPDAPLS